MWKPRYISPVFQTRVGFASTLLLLWVTFALAASAVALAESCNLVENPGFEEVTGGFPVAWEVFGSNAKVEASQEVVHSGRYSAKIVDESTTIGMGLRSFPVVVTPGKEYKASVYSYNVQGLSWLYLEFWDANNMRIRVYIGNNSVARAWNEIVVTGVAPEGAAYATLLMYSQGMNVGTLYFDDAALESEAEPLNIWLIAFTCLLLQ